MEVRNALSKNEVSERRLGGIPNYIGDHISTANKDYQ